MNNPPQVGQRYWVPTVTAPFYDWVHKLLAWPVLGPAHDDEEIIGFKWKHYHIDWRFVSTRMIKIIRRSGTFHNWVLHERNNFPLPDPVLALRKCYRPMPAFNLVADWTPVLEQAYQEHHLKPPAYVCPHKGIPLASLPPDSMGCVVCPAHGLRWNLETGRLVSSRQNRSY